MDKERPCYYNIKSRFPPEAFLGKSEVKVKESNTKVLAQEGSVIDVSGAPEHWVHVGSQMMLAQCIEIWSFYQAQTNQAKRILTLKLRSQEYALDFVVTTLVPMR